MKNQREFVVGLLVGVGLMLFINWVSGFSQPNAREELERFEKHLSNREIQNAYDMLLAAIRVAPGNDAVFKACMRFVEKATGESNEYQILVQDVYQRAGDMIPFLPISRIGEARGLHTKLGNTLFASEIIASSDDPMSEIDKLLETVKSGKMPAMVRTELLQEIGNELSNQAKRFALKPTPPASPGEFWDRWNRANERYQTVQKEVLVSLYKELKQRVDLWITRKIRFLKEYGEVGIAETHQMNDKIILLVLEGQSMLRELMPYIEARIKDVEQDKEAEVLEKHLSELTRLREWNYNRWALDRIDKVESSGGTVTDRLKSLAVIDETRLSAFVNQRFNEVWKVIFESGVKEDKVEGTKLRILREYTP